MTQPTPSITQHGSISATPAETSSHIPNYDASDCDYIKYWQFRQYEHEAEKIALAKLLPASGESLMDLGGGYGRLTPFYAPRFKKVIIIDTSGKHLQQAQVMLSSLELENVEVKQGDIYNLPLKNESQDTALMVRVMHHLHHPERAFREIERVLQPGGLFILEFPNKCHFKAAIRGFLRGEIDFCFNLKPYQQPAAGEEGIFYNFHPRHIRQLLKAAGFRVERTISVSNLRSPLLKSLLPQNFLLALENLAQVFLTPFSFGPSVFVKCRKELLLPPS